MLLNFFLSHAVLSKHQPMKFTTGSEEAFLESDALLERALRLSYAIVLV